MAIDFSYQKEKKYIILFLALLAVIVFINFNKETPQEASVETYSKQAVKENVAINLNILKSPFLKKMEKYEQIPMIEEKMGRINPFISY